MNAYIKFGENLSICSQDIEQKLNFGVYQAIVDPIRDIRSKFEHKIM